MLNCWNTQMCLNMLTYVECYENKQNSWTPFVSNKYAAITTLKYIWRVEIHRNDWNTFRNAHKRELQSFKAVAPPVKKGRVHSDDPRLERIGERLPSPKMPCLWAPSGPSRAYPIICPGPALDGSCTDGQGRGGSSALSVQGGPGSPYCTRAFSMRRCAVLCSSSGRRRPIAHSQRNWWARRTLRRILRFALLGSTGANRHFSTFPTFPDFYGLNFTV